MAGARYPWVWDYDIDAQQFDEILAGRLTIGRKYREWAAIRLIECATYPEMIRRLLWKDGRDGDPIFERRNKGAGSILSSITSKSDTPKC